MGDIELRKPIDSILFLVVLCLVMIGGIMIMSTSSVVGEANYNDSYYFIKKHLVFLVMGIVAMGVGIKFPHQKYRKYALPGFLFSLVLLVCPLIPGIGVKTYGASRWINLGFMTLQPVEIAKFFFAIFLALSLSNKRHQLMNFRKGMFPILMVAVMPILILLLQPDLGNSILMSSVIFVLLFLSPVNLKHLWSMLGVGLLGLVGSIATHPYQLSRVKGFLFPWDDPLGRNYHVIQSFIAIGSGGFFGLGLGESKLKYSYLPLQYSDFIFSIICEEGGFITAVMVILLYSVLFYRGIKIAVQAGNYFSFYLAVALTVLLTIQAYINVGVANGVFPAKGIPLTFISFGGTSLISSLFLSGVLLNISRYRPKVKEE
jgi:cell division protein FtsW